MCKIVQSVREPTRILSGRIVRLGVPIGRQRILRWLPMGESVERTRTNSYPLEIPLDKPQPCLAELQPKRVEDEAYPNQSTQWFLHGSG